ncbi:MAG TPA: ArsI/CadI family heavy metal resistance metalloenzyme [Gammaproteobacteria bacterium]|nr:ArsI/CadI family heavy metal resistance metalloenzyme [Gammaproteobacteria bacterium]
MKRLHVHVAVADLASSIRFYATLFGTEPTVLKDDYAKWMLDDPRVNFAISTRGKRPGLDHLGIQAESREELGEIAARLKAAEVATQDQATTRCCYAESSKTWSADPQGIAWESFYSFGESTTSVEAGRESQVQMSPGKPTVEKGGACCARPGA